MPPAPVTAATVVQLLATLCPGFFKNIKIYLPILVLNIKAVKITEKKLFADCVEYHIDILKMVETMSRVFGPMIFIQYSFSSIILCSSVYALSQMVPFSPEFIACLVYILCMFFQIFVICLSGNQVSLEFAELGPEMYNTNWFLLSINAQKHVAMMMMSSVKPIIFSCGHVATLSLESFKR
ncbi:GSCOCT00009419001.3-RA-CDS, partial [Cotesia congregata]